MAFYRRERLVERGSPPKAHPVAVRAGWKVAVMARSRLGSAAVEFAFALPVLLLMIYGMIEFGLALWTQATLEYAVEQAARYAIINNDSSQSNDDFETEIIDAAKDNATGIDTDEPPLTLDVDFEPESGSRNYVKVTATYQYDVLLLFDLINPITLSTSSRVPVFE